MPARNRAHYSGDYTRRARELVARAYADPMTRCQRILENGAVCGLTLAQHPRHKSGTPARWDAGHVNDGQVDGPLRPEVSTCNRSAGARAGARRKRSFRTSRRW